MKQYVTDIADMAISKEPDSQLVTFSLGSCIGVAIYDSEKKVGGLLHFMLPDSTIDPHKAHKKPCMFADTGIPKLFKSAYQLGLEKSKARVVFVGGAQVIDSDDTLKIGMRNYAALRKIFWKNNILISAEDVGGTTNRSLFLDIGTGKIWIRNSMKSTKSL